MVYLSENTNDSVNSSQPQSENLLKKFDIPINHLDYKYIEECTNAKELEQIVQILRSGQEGYYPHLLKFTESRLEATNPNSKVLKTPIPCLTKKDLSPAEWAIIEEDMKNWREEMKERELELASMKHISDDNEKYPIRELDTCKSSCKSEKKNERIKSMDYDSWEKLDIDAELLKLDLEEERLKKETIKKAEEKEKLRNIVVNPDNMTRAELFQAAMNAKNIGNDFYRANEFEEALHYYTNSLAFSPDSVVFCNRAMTNIKLARYNCAIDDCNESLKLDASNKKALYRKAVALKHLKRFDESVQILEQLIQIDPNNTAAQQMLQEIQPKATSKIPVRMIVQEITAGQLIVDPIPGPSTSTGPHYHVVRVQPGEEQFYIDKTKKTPAKSDNHVIYLNHPPKSDKLNKKEIETEIDSFDHRASGEPQWITNSFEFYRKWKNLRGDIWLHGHSQLLRSINPNNISRVLNSKLDSDMLSTILHCLEMHFMKEEDGTYLTTVLEELLKCSRVEITIMLLSQDDKRIILRLINHLNALDFQLSTYTIQQYYRLLEIM